MVKPQRQLPKNFYNLVSGVAKYIEYTDAQEKETNKKKPIKNQK